MVLPLTLWLVLWALLGLPWGDFPTTPDTTRIQWSLDPLKRPDDAAVNLLFYAPFGVMCASLDWPVAAVAAGAAALSGLTETAQLFSRSRVPSLRDLVLNTAGAALGCAWAVRRRSLAAKRRLEASRMLHRRRVA